MKLKETYPDYFRYEKRLSGDKSRKSSKELRKLESPIILKSTEPGTVVQKIEHKNFRKSKRAKNTPLNKLAIENGYKSYSDYVISSHWKQMRSKVLKSRGYKCETCESRKRLQVHHLTYKRFGCELEQDLKVLCYKCHRQEHLK